MSVAADLRHLVRRLGERYGLPASTARKLAGEVDIQFRSRNAGARVPARDAALVRATISAEFDGTSTSRDRICRRLGISRTTFYRHLSNSRSQPDA